MVYYFCSLHPILMKVYSGPENTGVISPVVTMGIFDGVHLGHKALLSRLVSVAEETGGEPMVLTFHPHPRIVLSKSPSKLFYLSTMDEKKELLASYGIKHLVIIDFNHSFSNITASEFLERILIGKLHAAYLLAGHNHHFGKRGEGDTRTIEECAVHTGLKFERFEGISTSEGYISSTLIREALLDGSLERANMMLGYCYQMKGTVVGGKHLGKLIGFPTANLNPLDPHKLIPGNGVYAVEAIVEGRALKGMLSIGCNPTVNKKPGKRTIEVNLFDFNEEIYGREIKLIFRYRMRDEKLFPGVDALIRQMALDKEQALGLLEKQ